MKKVKDSELVSTERAEITRIAKRFVSYKTGENVSTSLLYFLQNELRVNIGKCKRADLYGVLGILGYVRDPQLDEK